MLVRSGVFLPGAVACLGALGLVVGSLLNRGRYPLAALGTGVAFAMLSWWWLGGDAAGSHEPVALTLILAALLYLAAVTILLALIDHHTLRLPNAIVMPALLVLLILLAAAAAYDADGRLRWQFARAVVSACALTLGYAALWVCWPAGVGFGDVKLAAVLGLALGWFGFGAVIVGTIAALLLAGAYGGGLLLSKRGGRKSRIPFGPWMILGAWFGIVAGEPLSNGYLGAVLA